MKKKQNKKGFAAITKTIIGFIKDESGFVSKDKVLKIGIGTAASLGFMGSGFAAYRISTGDDLAGCDDAWLVSDFGNVHQNFTRFEPIDGTNCVRLQHSNTTLSDLRHTSHDFHLHARGRIDAKGWIGVVDYPSRADRANPDLECSH